MTGSDGATLDPARDFGAGVAESVFGQDRGAGGTPLRDRTATLKDHATGRIRGFADVGKRQVTDSLDGVVAAAREIADKLGDGAFGPVGDYAKSAADALEHWAEGVKAKSVDELVDDGRALVRAQPALAVGVAVVAGFVISRLLKAGS